MAYGLEDRDAVDELFSLSLEDHLTPTQPERLRMPSPPIMRPLRGDDTSPQPSRLRLPSPPPTKPTKDKSAPIYSDSDTTSSLSSTPSSPDLSPVLSPAGPETPSALSPSDQAALLTRIHSGLSYTATQKSLNLPITQTTRFSLCPQYPTHLPALTLLRKHAILISISPTHELYELGIPRPDWVQEGAITGIHDAQWWMGKSRAEIKAGPWADEADVKVAEARMRGVETRKKKRRGKGEREREWKLREGVRRAEEGEGSEDDEHEKMEDEEEEGEEDEADEGETMEGVQYGSLELATTSTKRLRSQVGSTSSPSSRKLRSPGGLESSPSSRVLRIRKL
ncbi:hypothetical protein GGP41_003618 [Bipolaris sorokiniana]|uniref:Uncharacterized protein n=1 Tax=Cochliobolus sativus TaxID=45130 RepID=A0A8H5ZCJ5_COCSA|nr:hypothetical protein GGP41_003618 [Bipolaris sorokiniana]